MKKVTVFNGYVGIQRDFWGFDDADTSRCGSVFERDLVVMVDFEQEEGIEDLVRQHSGGHECLGFVVDYVRGEEFKCMELTGDGGFYTMLFLAKDIARLIRCWPRIEFCGE